MKITIECECGNRHTMEVHAKKYLQFRDNLEAGHFRYLDTKIENDMLKEFMIRCDNCGNYIYLGMD